MQKTTIRPTAPYLQEIKADSSVNIRKIIATLVMSGFALLMIVPFIWMISTSFKSPADVFKYPVQWIPSSLNWEHHIKVWSGNDSFITYYLNSLKISLISTAGGSVLLCFCRLRVCPDSVQGAGAAVPGLPVDDDGSAAGAVRAEVSDV